MDCLKRSEVRIGDITLQNDVCTQRNTVYDVGGGLHGVVTEMLKRFGDVENLMP